MNIAIEGRNLYLRPAFSDLSLCGISREVRFALLEPLKIGVDSAKLRMRIEPER